MPCIRGAPAVRVEPLLSGADFSICPIIAMRSTSAAGSGMRWAGIGTSNAEAPGDPDRWCSKRVARVARAA
jgi:hypothetical protein